MEYKYGTQVNYKVGDISGKGTIVGKALTELFVIGCTYIIEDKNIMSDTYPYTHFVLNETQFEVEHK